LKINQDGLNVLNVAYRIHDGKTLRIIENTNFYKRLSLFDVHSESDKNQHLNLLIYTERQGK